MPNNSTLLILGAGASADVGYPVGKELKRRILLKLESGEYAKIAADAGFRLTEVEDFRHHFARSGLPTIDSFLAENLDLADLGKFLISVDLTSCEDQEELMGRGQNSWYVELRRILGRGLEHLEKSNVTICTFNYDRSLLHFLYSAYCSVARSQIYRARLPELLSRLEFLQMYGGLPPLLWQGGADSRDYGDTADFGFLRRASVGIRTPDDAVNQRFMGSNPEDMIKNARRVYFLGFGFDQLNMTSLGMPRFAQPGVYIHPKHGHKFNATAIGLTAKQRSDLKGNYNMRFFDDINAAMQAINDEE